MKLLKSESYVKMPWKNGLGMTTELFKVVGHNGDLQFRISSAKVENSGPFSLFEGLQRILVNFGPSPMILKLGSAQTVVTTKILEPWSLLHFDGAEHVYCDVQDPSTDFNIFYRPSEFEVQVSTVEVFRESSISLLAGFQTLAFVAQGRVSMRAKTSQDALIAFESDSVTEDSQNADEWTVMPVDEEKSRIVVVRWRRIC